MHRLHDGPLRARKELVPPSVLERRSKSVRPRKLPTVPELEADAVDSDKARQLVEKLCARRELPNPDDLHQRLQLIHFACHQRPGKRSCLPLSEEGTLRLPAHLRRSRCLLGLRFLPQMPLLRSPPLRADRLRHGTRPAAGAVDIRRQ